MRTTAPPAFEMQFESADGEYSTRFEPIDKWDGRIDVTISEVAMRWHVLTIDREDDGGIVLSGMTNGSQALWGDQFWFELRLHDKPPIIRYWGNQVIWRVDRAN